MRRSGFTKPTYEEAIEKRRKRAEKLKARLGTATVKRTATGPRKRSKKASLLAGFNAKVRAKYNYTCQFPGCGYYSKTIDVQHINKKSQRPDLKYDISNGITLCRLHHDWIDNTVEGRKMGLQLGLHKIDSYEKAQKSKNLEPLD